MSNPMSPYRVPEQLEQMTPDAISSWARVRGSKSLLIAVELGLFAVISKTGPLDAEELRERLGLHPRSARISLTPLSHSGWLRVTSLGTQSLRRPNSSSTQQSPATSVECWKWPTCVCLHSGVR